MEDGVGLTGAVKRGGVEPGEAVIGQLEAGVLAGDDQPRPLATRRQRMGNRTKLDGFRTRSDDKRDT